MNTAIIGAGICGLWAATQMQDSNCEITVFEKSKGVGGRMATKRIGSEKFDHGAQFYSHNTDTNAVHQIWNAAGLISPWFAKNEILRYRSKSGITTLGKHLSQNLNVQLNKKLISIKPKNNTYELQFECETKSTADRVILTSPVPQSVEILKSSQIMYPSDLDNVKYAKAVVLLIENITTDSNIPTESGYYENSESKTIFSISDQQKKGNCVHNSWTITMSAEFSEHVFNLGDEEILKLTVSEVLKLIPDLTYQNVILKKWRYSHPQNIYRDSFLKLENESIYLCGDAFGGASVSGAVLSANALVKSF